MLIEHLSTPLPDSEKPTSAQDPGQGAGALRWLEQQTLQKCKGCPPQVGMEAAGGKGAASFSHCWWVPGEGGRGPA